jgi:hypothetical protein
MLKFVSRTQVAASCLKFKTFFLINDGSGGAPYAMQINCLCDITVYANNWYVYCTTVKYFVTNDVAF